MYNVLHEETRRLLEQVEDVNARAMLRHLAVRLAETAISDHKRFDELSKFSQQIEGKLRVQGKYSSKDSIIIRNPPFDPNDKQTFHKFEGLFQNFSEL